MSNLKNQKLIADIDLLSQIPNRPLTSLSGSDYQAYQNLREAADLLHGTTEFQAISQYLKSKPKPNGLQVNTVGAFLYGCLREDGPDPFCSPLCIGSVLNTGDCPYQVWNFENGHLEKLNNQTVPEARVYYSGNFNYQIYQNQLQAAGVTGGLLISNSQPNLQTPFTLPSPTAPLISTIKQDLPKLLSEAKQELPILEQQAKNEVRHLVTQAMAPKKTSFFTWVLIFLIIIALALLGYYIFNRFK